MLFFLKVEVTKLPAHIPVSEFLATVAHEWEYFERLERRGKVLAGGKMTGRRGAIAIVEAASAEEMESIVDNLPLFPYFDSIEVLPLVPSSRAYSDVKRLSKMVALKEKSTGVGEARVGPSSKKPARPK